MPVNRNALIRYKTIDNCLRNKYRRWTLEDLIKACSDALYEFEGINKGISRRTIQMDIQMMRSEKLGYNAPIVVYDNKYYKYDNEEYSITNIPLTKQDMDILSGAVEVIRQFKNFSYFSDMGDIVNRLEDRITSARKYVKPVIDFEKNDYLKGLDHLDFIYHSIIQKQPLRILYQSFKARSATEIIFSAYLLKEYRNRWFVFGTRKSSDVVLNLALDRIEHLDFAYGEQFQALPEFDPETFFDDIIGVSKSRGMQSKRIIFRANAGNSPYIRTKPLHTSQRIVEELPDGSVIFEVDIIVNQELIREFLGYGNGIKVLFPQDLVDLIKLKLERALKQYSH